MRAYDHDAATARRIAAAMRERPGQLVSYYAAMLRLPPAVVDRLIRR